MSLSDAFKLHPELLKAGEWLQAYFNNKSISVDIGLLTRENNYPLLLIKPGSSTPEEIRESLEQHGSLASNSFNALNLKSCLYTQNDGSLLIMGGIPIVTQIARQLDDLSLTPA